MSVQLNLPARLDNGAAADLIAAFQSHQGVALRVNAQDVTHLGTLSAQVLVAAIQSWAAAGAKMSFHAPSHALKSAWADLGLAKIDFPTDDGAAQ